MSRVNNWIKYIEDLSPLEQYEKLLEALIAREGMLDIPPSEDLIYNSLSLRLSFLLQSVFKKQRDKIKSLDGKASTKPMDYGFLWDWEFEPWKIKGVFNNKQYIDLIDDRLKTIWKDEAIVDSRINYIISTKHGKSRFNERIDAF